MTTEPYSLDTLLDKLPALRAEIQKRIVGQEEVIEQLLLAFIAGGHALLEGAPGLAKTLMIRTLAQAVDLDFRRIQFTPDLMPTDILGTEVLQVDPETGTRRFEFVKGPLFAHIILADEINRTPPKTQAALLEAMQESALTYAGKTYPMQRPFFILATQNPIEQAGTFPLPEAQLDRFLLYIHVGYPGEEEELAVLEQTTATSQLPVGHVLTAEEVLQLQRRVREVHINRQLLTYVNLLVRASRPDARASEKVREWVDWGAGPRAGQAMILCAKARALLHGRLAVTPDDIRQVVKPVMRHRMLLNFRAEAEGVTTDDLADHLLDTISLPQGKIR